SLSRTPRRSSARWRPAAPGRRARCPGTPSAATTASARGTGRRCGPTTRTTWEFAWRSCLDQVLEHGLQVVVGRGDLVNAAELPRRRERGHPRVERVGLRGLHDDRLVLELQAQHIVLRQELARERPGPIRADVDRVRVLVDQIADLMDV